MMTPVPDRARQAPSIPSITFFSPASLKTQNTPLKKTSVNYGENLVSIRTYVDSKSASTGFSSKLTSSIDSTYYFFALAFQVPQNAKNLQKSSHKLQKNLGPIYTCVDSKLTNTCSRSNLTSSINFTNQMFHLAPFLSPKSPKIITYNGKTSIEICVNVNSK